MDQLCTFTTSTSSKIVSFHQGNPQSTSGCIQRNAGASGAASNDQEIVGFISLLVGFQLIPVYCSSSQSVEAILNLLFERCLRSPAGESAAPSEICYLFFSCLDIWEARWDDRTIRSCRRWDSCPLGAWDVARSVGYVQDCATAKGGGSRCV